MNDTGNATGLTGSAGSVGSVGAPTRIRYLIGDATVPQGDGPKVIAHVCNDQGGWGAGFVLALSRRWDAPEAVYRSWFAATVGGSESARQYPLVLGNTTFVAVEKNIVVANMVAQQGFGQGSVPVPLRYGPLRRCLADLARYCLGERHGGTDRHPAVRDSDRIGGDRTGVPVSVHMPRIGCGLAGGSWNMVAPIIEQTLCAYGIEVTVYDLALPGLQ